jgi:hypothetical protein
MCSPLCPCPIEAEEKYYNLTAWKRDPSLKRFNAGEFISFDQCYLKLVKEEHIPKSD